MRRFHERERSMKISRREKRERDKCEISRERERELRRFNEKRE